MNGRNPLLLQGLDVYSLELIPFITALSVQERLSRIFSRYSSQKRRPFFGFFGDAHPAEGHCRSMPTDLAALLLQLLRKIDEASWATKFFGLVSYIFCKSRIWNWFFKLVLLGQFFRLISGTTEGRKFLLNFYIPVL